MKLHNTKVVKKKIIRDEVFRKILDDYELLDKLKEATGLRENSVRQIAYRKSHRRLMDVNIMAVVKNHTKWTDKEIFTTV